MHIISNKILYIQDASNIFFTKLWKVHVQIQQQLPYIDPKLKIMNIVINWQHIYILDIKKLI